jgi:hypothetical protein
MSAINYRVLLVSAPDRVNSRLIFRLVFGLLHVSNTTVMACLGQVGT